VLGKTNFFQNERKIPSLGGSKIGTKAAFVMANKRSFYEF